MKSAGEFRELKATDPGGIDLYLMNGKAANENPTFIAKHGSFYWSTESND